jgi:drug/metabolite transporter (DMT)-like permease
MHKHHTFTGLISGLGAAAIWGGMYVVSKVVLEVIPPFSLLTLRLIMGAIALGVVIYFRDRRSGTKQTITKEFFWTSFLVGFVGYGISLGFQFVGTKLSTASNGALVTSATPAFVLLFAPFLLGEKSTPRRIIALVISTLGVLAVIDPRNAELSPSLFWGNMSLLAAALTWALYSVLVRKVSKSYGSVDIQYDHVVGRFTIEHCVGNLGNQHTRHRRDHMGHHRRAAIFGDHLHCNCDVPLELRLRRIARCRGVTDVLCPAGSWYAARLVFPR